MMDQDVILAATNWKALDAWEADPEATILTNPTGTLYVVGRWPAVGIGHAAWTQASPEELVALMRRGHP